jgi:SAM-dependent methyltransferase
VEPARLTQISGEAGGMKLNLGCGFDKREGFVNADGFEACNPDVLMDIETAPWPFEDNQFDYVLMKHVLEHVGATLEKFKQVMQELYRVTCAGGIVEIHVPHFRHDMFWSDPTHVRAFTTTTFEMMSRAKNDAWIASRSNYTMLSYLLDVDFELVEGTQAYDGYWLQKEAAGEITREQLREAGRSQMNVVQELRVKLKTIK